MADTARLQQQPQSQAVSDTKPPGAEVGTASQNTGGLGGWAAFLDEAEYVPQLTFPGSIPTYHRMRSDSQIEALHLGTVQPIREYRWWIDPNKAPKKLVEAAATDLGLPVKGEDPEESGIKRAAAKFDFDAFLSDALLGPLYGFMHFEIVGEIQEALDWRMKKLAPRHPRTIQQFKVDDHGELLAIKQNFGPNFAATPPEILAQKLLTLTWRPEAGTVVGRSMLRSMYREWLVKDRVLRIATINLERAGGVPVLEASQGASDKQIEDLAQMARQFKVAEGGGGAVPFGTKVTLVGGSVPDAISLMTYCDECMARVWALMLIQLGQTQTGSRALGGEFAIYAARAQRLMGKWICSAVNNFLDRYVEWNEPLADYAPRLAFEPSKPEGMSVTDLVSLLDAGALTTDPELEEWLRSEHNLPNKPEMPEHPDLGELTPDEVALVQNSRTPPPLPGQPTNPDAPQGKPGEPTFKQTPMPKRALDPTVTQPTLASGSLTLPRLHRGIRASLTLPDRQLRRAPSANEIRAAVDFRALDEAHAGTVARLHAHYLNETLPSQIKSLGDQLRAGVKPHELTAPVAGIEAIARHLGTAAESGVSTAIREAQAQGLRPDAGVYAGVAQAARDRTLAQAEHVATLNANGLSLGAQRRAGRLASRVRSPERRAKDLERHLTAQKHVYERENLKGAATMAQNSGRLTAFEALAAASNPEVATATAEYEASEILDDRTCGPCEAVDGTTYESLDEAEADYATGGYVDCEGGPNCRGTLVAIYPEQNPVGGEGDLREAEPGYLGGGGGAAEAAPEDVIPPEEVVPEPEPVPPVETATTPEAGEAGPLLAKAQTITTHDEAVAFLKDDVGIKGEVEFGPKLRGAAEGRYKPGSQGEIHQEQARDFIRQLVESVAEARDTFGPAARVDHIISNTRAKEVYKELTRRPRGKGLGNAHAAIRTWPTLVRNELIFNDAKSFEQLVAKDGRETSGGYVARATTDPRGIFMHEMGHTLENGLSGLARALPRLLADSGLASTAQARGMAPFVSTYATTKSSETWAESFATLMRPGGVAEDFSYTGTNERMRELYPDADAKTKEALGRLRDNFNAWVDENHPGTSHIPER